MERKRLTRSCRLQRPPDVERAAAWLCQSAGDAETKRDSHHSRAQALATTRP